MLHSKTSLIESQFKQEPYRWVIVLIYGLMVTMVGINGVNINPIANKLQETYEVTPEIINAIPMGNIMLYAIVNLPANYFIDNIGIRTGLLIGGALALIGSLVELLVNTNFYLLIMGQLLVGLSQPFVLNCTTKIATFWFFKEKRAAIVSIFTVLNLLGTGVGFIIPTLFVSEDSDQSSAKKQVFQLMLYETIFCAVCVLLLVLFLRNKPSVPPSLGSKIEKTPFKQSLQSLMTNKNSLKLFTGFALFCGPLNTLSGLLNFIFRPYGFSDTEISYFGVALLFAGIIGSFLVTLYVSRTLKYANMNKILTACSILLLLLIIVVLRFYNNFIVIETLLAFTGLFVTPIYPITFDFGCEIAFPVGEAQIVGILTAGVNICSFFLILIIELTFGFGTIRQSNMIMIFILSLMTIGAGFYFWTENNLIRRNLEEEYDEKQKLKSDSSLNQQQL